MRFAILSTSNYLRDVVRVRYLDLWAIAYTFAATHMSQPRITQFADAYARAEQDIAEADMLSPQEFEASGRTYSEEHYCERQGP